MKNLLKMLVVLFLLVFSYCSSDNTTDPYEDATEFESLYLDLFNVTEYDDIEVYVTDSADVAIDLGLDAGDSSTIAVDGEDIYIISGDSTVTEDVQISIDCRKILFIQGDDSSKSAYAFECLPDSVVFNDELIIDVASSGFNNHPNSNVVKLLEYNQNSNKWNVIATEQKTNPRIQFGIEHFSKYAISD